MKKGNCVTRIGGVTAETTFNATLIGLNSIESSFVMVSTSLTTTARANVFGGTFPSEFCGYKVTRRGVVDVTTNITSANGGIIYSSFTVFTTKQTFRRVHGSVKCPRLGMVVNTARTNVSINRSNTARRYGRSVTLVHAVPNVAVVGPTSTMRTRGTIYTTFRRGNPVCVQFNELTIPIIFSSSCGFRVNGNIALHRNGSIAVVTANLVMGRTLRTCRLLGRRNVGTHIVGVTAVGPLSARVILGTTGRANTVIATRRRSIVNNLNDTISRCLDRRCPAPVVGLNIGSRFNRSNPTIGLLSRFNLHTIGVIRGTGGTVSLGGWFLVCSGQREVSTICFLGGIVLSLAGKYFNVVVLKYWRFM